MREPNLEAMIEFLYEAGFDVTDPEDNDDAVIDHMFCTKKNLTSELDQLFYYCKKELAPSVVDYVAAKCSGKRKKRVISSLVSIYPLSRYIIIEMLNRAESSPAELIEFFDLDHQLISGVQRTLDLIQKNSVANNYDFNTYSGNIDKLLDGIQQLQSEKESMKKEYEEYQEKISEKNLLEKEIRELKEFNEEKINQEIEKKEKERDQLRWKKEEQEQQWKELIKEIEEISKLLEQKETSSAENSEYEKALRALEKCIKALDKEAR